MINVCAKCGLYRVDKTVTGPSGVADESKPGSPAHPMRGSQTAMAACPHCGHQHPFQRLPLLLIGGASATGKSAILHELSGHFNQAVLLEVDLLWLAEFENPTDGHRKFHETWLRLAKNIGQNGRPERPSSSPLRRRPGRTREYRELRGETLFQRHSLLGTGL